MGNWNDLNCKAKRRIVCELVAESNSFYDFITPNYAEENLNYVIFDAYLRSLEKATSCPETPIEKTNERKCKYLFSDPYVLHSLYLYVIRLIFIVE